MLDRLAQLPTFFEKVFPRYHDAMGTDLRIPLSPSYNHRRTLQAARESEKLSNPKQEYWEVHTGSYSDTNTTILPPEALRVLRREFPTLNGDELLLAKHLQTLLHHHSGPDPLKIVDAGGMFGLSWVRLANIFKADVASGKLNLIVTNLHFNPDQVKSNLVHGHGETYHLLPPQDFSFWQKNHHLVQFINCATNQLPNHIDLLFEDNSLTFNSFTPASTRLTLLSKLKPGGMLITPDSLTGTRPSNVSAADLHTDLDAFDQALRQSTQFRWHKSISLSGKPYRLADHWKLISKSSNTRLSY
jgi:hypothetical protein